MARAAASASDPTISEWLKVPKAFSWRSCKAAWFRSVRSSNVRVVVMSNAASKEWRRARPTSAAARETPKAQAEDTPMVRSVSSPGLTWKNQEVAAAMRPVAMAEYTAALRNARLVDTDDTKGMGAMVARSA